MVGKCETVLKLPYLQNDMQQDGRSTTVCLRFLLQVIINGWFGQVKFGTEVNCNIFVYCMQNNSSFKLFKHEAILIHSLSLLYFRSQNNAVRSIHIPCLAQYHRHTVISMFAGLWKNQGCSVGKGKHLSFTPKDADKFWHPPSVLPWDFSLDKTAGT
jgi:hypothetical protein